MTGPYAKLNPMTCERPRKGDAQFPAPLRRISAMSTALLRVPSPRSKHYQVPFPCGMQRWTADELRSDHVTLSADPSISQGHRPLRRGQTGCKSRVLPLILMPTNH